jgi:tRNA(fMet)-specific endonuclease VapC
MIFFLDTHICIYHLNDTAPQVSDRLERLPTKSIKIPSMVAAELLYGAEKSSRREENLICCREFLSIYEIIPFDEKASAPYAAIRLALEQKGAPIGGNDLIIAATVLANDGALVTHNISEFSRVEGLVVEDWTHNNRR